MHEISVLQAAIAKYYVNHSQASQQNPMSSIVAKKVDAIISGDETNWSRFVSSLAHPTDGITVHDAAYIQFPSYQITFSLETKGFDFGRKRSRFVVTLSLLCPFYTGFVHDEFLFDSYYEDLPPMFSIIYSVPSDSPFLQTLQSAVYSGLESEFSSYKYVDHTLLMKRTMPGVFPFSEYESYDQNNVTSSYYRLLFDGFFIEANCSVLT